MAELHLPRTNAILRALTPCERESFYRYGMEVDFAANMLMHEAGSVLSHIHFLHSGLVSLQIVTSSGSIAEAGFVGADGVVGTSYGASRISFTRAMVTSKAKALRVPLQHFETIMNRSGNLRDSINQNNNRITERGQQLAACNLLHSMEARLCRWLLQVLEHSEESDVVVTQDNLAHMLGVTRTRLNDALKTLHNLRAVTPRQRGVLKIIDASIVAERACDCYRAMHRLNSE